MKDLQGKVAVITGAASGIGRAMTDRFIAAGMKIVLADVDEVKLRNVEAELTENGADVFPVTVDVSLGECVEELARKTLEKYGAAHVLCNNAGVAGVGDQWTGTMSVWDWVININLYGVVHGIRSFLPIMLDHARVTRVAATGQGDARGPGAGGGIEEVDRRHRTAHSIIAPGRQDSTVSEDDELWPTDRAADTLPSPVAVRWRGAAKPALAIATLAAHKRQGGAVVAEAERRFIGPTGNVPHRHRLPGKTVRALIERRCPFATVFGGPLGGTGAVGDPPGDSIVPGDSPQPVVLGEDARGA